jgi:molybdopterin-containing oxidoreductase family membrane subunit
LYKGAKSKGVVGLAATVATALVIVEGWILTVSAGSPLWHSALIPVVFVVEALLVAGSVVLMAKPKDEGELLRRALAALLAAAFVLSLVELVAVSYGGDVDAAAAMKLLVAGSFAPMYWGQMLIGVALPFVLLVWLSRNQGVVRVAAALAILGVLVAKTNLLVAGRAIPFMQPPGSYTPTVVEVAGLVGILGLAGFLYVFGQRVLKGGA